ncbi:hypothetical protein Tco_1476008 [Tanacetum coccineum]
MFGLLKELTASKTPEKVLIREEARHPITKNVNIISLIRIEEGGNRENNMEIDKSVMKPGKSDEERPPKGIDMKNEVKRKADDEPTKSARKKSRRMKRMSQQEFPVPMIKTFGIRVMETSLKFFDFNTSSLQERRTVSTVAEVLKHLALSNFTAIFTYPAFKQLAIKKGGNMALFIRRVLVGEPSNP